MWDDVDAGGDIRVVVSNHGFEHISSTVTIEWINLGRTGSQVAGAVQISELSKGYWSVGAPVLQWNLKKKVCEISFSATHSYANKEHEFSARLDTVGRYSVLKWTGAAF